jgi:hypothetical protein
VRLVERLNIFDDIAIEARREEKSESEASIADTIAHQLTRSIEENGMKTQSSSKNSRNSSATP